MTWFNVILRKCLGSLVTIDWGCWNDRVRQEEEAAMSSTSVACEMMRNHLVNSIPLEKKNRGHWFRYSLGLPD